MDTVLNIKANDTKLLEIESNLLGYWENDIWNTEHPLLSQFNNCVHEKTYRNIDFSTFSSKLKNEVKYFILSRLKDKEVRLYDTVVENYCKAFKQVSNFLNQYYPSISSFKELDIEKSLMQLRSYLIEKGIQLRKIPSNKKYTKYESLLNQLHIFYTNFYDIKTESEKDIWDARNIPGARVDYTKAEYFLKFNEIPTKFASMVKKYIKFRISYLSSWAMSD